MTPERVLALLEEARKDVLDAAETPDDAVKAGQFDIWPVEHLDQPSGIHADGFKFYVWANRIADTIAHLDDEAADEYVMCLSDWMWDSSLSRAEGMWTTRTIVLGFCSKNPSSTTMLATVAIRNGHTLHTWLTGDP
jgi:hypothetical protein